jgi:hypothetical protein
MPALMLTSLQSIRRDLVHAMRTLAKERAFTLVCVLSLGIGMGAVVALATFSRAMNAPARGIDTDGLVEVLVLPEGPLREKAGQWALERWSYPDYQALRDADVGMQLTGWTSTSEFGEPTPDQKHAVSRVDTLYVSPNYFQTFGVPLARGPRLRRFALDDSPSAEPRVILSHDLWTSRVGGDPDIIGKSVMVDGVPHTVVGIAPDGLPRALPFLRLPRPCCGCRSNAIRASGRPRVCGTIRAADWIRIHGRLASRGEPRPGARADLVGGGDAREPISRDEPVQGGHGRAVRRSVPLAVPSRCACSACCFSLAGAVLLIVCVNISGMMLVRGATRAHELSIRAALGADRRTLAQHLFFEALVLALAAGDAQRGRAVRHSRGDWLVDGRAGAGRGRFRCHRCADRCKPLPRGQRASSDCCPPSASAAPACCRRCRTMPAAAARRIRAHRIAAMVQIGVAVPFLVISGVMIDRVRTADYGLPLAGLAGARIPASARQQEAGSIRSAVDGLRQAAGVRSVAIADGMPIDFDYREFRVAAPTMRRSPPRTSRASVKGSSRRSAHGCCAVERSRLTTV